MYCVDIYTSKYKLWMNRYNVKEKSGKYGVYYTTKLDYKQKKKLIRKLKWKNIKYRCYEERWNRSSDYRKKFLNATKPPYRCRYCNRYLKTEYMVVDHIIPVDKAKSSTKAKNLLALQGIKNVNDVKNLAPSCYDCNSRKGAKMGLWFIRGILGKYKWFWIAKNIFLFFILILIIYILYYSLICNDEFLNFIKVII